MIKIDAHQHFWKFNPVRDSWINESMTAIQRDFMPADLEPVLKQHGFQGCVAVQADQSEQETEFLLGLADQHNFINGVVGWVDLQSADCNRRLEYFSAFKNLKGLRHILQGEADRALMLTPAFSRGVSALKRFDLTYDILIFPDQLGYTYQFVKKFEGHRFVIDHIAKPDIKNGSIDKWKKSISAIANCSNVWCKISGMVTEADWKHWKTEDFIPYLDHVFNSFGTNKVMFGSDWPVCNVAGGYDKMHDMIAGYVGKLSESEQLRFWGANAADFYKLD